jgi:uncharacterized protein YjbI with pentapeptide repeats
MPDMNSLTMTLLAETSVILLIALIVLLWLQIRSKNKQRKAVEQLVFQIKEQSKSRSEETGSFLQENYGLSNDELTVAAKTIDKQERLLFQKLVNALSQSDASEITSLDTSVYVLVDAYKSLTSKPVEAINNERADDLGSLNAKNSALTDELRVLRETVSNMSSEFQNMFGGGNKDDSDSGDLKDNVADAVLEGEEALGASEADASEADASEADASEADASEADASEADASEADASEADASEADASEADASEADASEADASEADASEADASEADASEADASKADASKAARNETEEKVDAP